MGKEMTQRQRIQSAHDVYLGFDVGKSFHWACALVGGEARIDRRVENRRDDVRAAIGEAIALAGELGTLVTVDQRNNIGALVVREARDMGCDVAYLTGSSESGARKMYPGVSKNDRFDAWVIAHTSEVSPQMLLPVPDAAETRLLGSQRRHCVKLATQATNRLRAVLLESDPGLEASLDLRKGWVLGILAELGGPVGIAACTKRRYHSVCTRVGAPVDEADALREACARSVATCTHPAGEDRCVKWLAEDTRRALAEAEAIRRISEGILAQDECYRCLRTVPGVGPVLAEALVSLVDVSLFESHDQLASLCGLAPANSQSGTSVDYATTPRTGNKELKCLLIFTCRSLIGTKNHFGSYYERVYERTRGDNKKKYKFALKAVARKRLKVIYAIMRDLVPYDESRWEHAA